MILKQQDNSYLLKYADIRLLVNPDTGGRIISLKLNDKEFLTGKNINPINYGSTFWPSPQSLWNWPPPYILDEGKYSVKQIGKTLLLVSQPDSTLGLQFEKEFSISEADTSIEIKYSIRNLSVEVKGVAPWEITRMPKGGLAFFPKGLTKPKVKNFDPIPFKEMNDILWYQNNKNEKLTNHKLSISDGSEGWLAYKTDDYIFVKKFTDVPLKDQSPEEGEIAVYVSPESAYVEIEAQGNYRHIGLNKTLQWEVKWYVRKLPEKIKAESGSKELAAFVRSIIK